MKLPEGFFTSGISCGIKKSQKKDLGLIFSESPCNVAGTFTQNSVRAFCVTDNEKVVKQKTQVKLVIVNSGNANACTGEEGLQALNQIKISAASLFDIQANNILTASTGIIGVPLEDELIIKALPESKTKLSRNFNNFSESIMTTDIREKIHGVKLGSNSSILGIAKGAGMIHPNMATMLVFIMTDVQLDKAELQKALSSSVENTFNQISVDNDMSTNDMCLLLSNGASDEKISFDEFKRALDEVCLELAKMIVRDGEGATKIFEAKVTGAKTQEEARRISKGIISSSLLKCAITGADPNWGRIMAAAGYHGKINQDTVCVKIFDKKVFEKGNVCDFNKSELSKKMKESECVLIELDLGSGGNHSARAWGCNMSEEYVKINSEYTT